MSWHCFLQNSKLAAIQSLGQWVLQTDPFPAELVRIDPLFEDFTTLKSLRFKRSKTSTELTPCLFVIENCGRYPSKQDYSVKKKHAHLQQGQNASVNQIDLGQQTTPTEQHLNQTDRDADLNMRRPGSLGSSFAK